MISRFNTIGGRRMGYQPLEKLLPMANNSVYRLVRLAAKRALEISETGAKLVDVPLEQKVTTTALEEIKQGKLYDKLTADAQAKASKK